MAGCTNERKENSQALKNPLNCGLQCTSEMVGEKESLDKTGSTENTVLVAVVIGQGPIIQLLVK
ncbi:MAG: hypothetical protein J6T10_03760 [Methanobrevibacter sp.]|nr:hypothetical protein [Methanobrevibacter sp.]